MGPDEEKVPYRIEVVGVTCDPGLAVARGIWRKARCFATAYMVANLNPDYAGIAVVRGDCIEGCANR